MCGILFKSKSIKLFLVCLVALAAGTLGAANTKAAQKMVSLLPNGPGRPFTWAAYPTTEIGIADARNGTEVTPSGSLQTASCDLILMSGEADRPVNAPIRTLERGYMPIVHYHFHDGSVRYDVTMFSWALSAAKPYRSPINFIRVKAFNEGSAPTTSVLTLALNYGAGQHRGISPRPKFDSNWIYSFRPGMALRANQVMFTFPTGAKPKLFISQGAPYSEPQKVKASANTPVLLVQYTVKLKSAQQTEFVFKMPVHPIASDDAPALQQLQQLSCPEALAACRTWWRRQIRGHGLQLCLHESKVVATFRASLMYLMLARDRLPASRPGGRPIYVQNVNKLQYHAFWFRDGSYMVRAYDLTGHSRRARQCLRYFFRRQSPDGNFISQSGQHDGWGQVLWAIGQHVQLTGDMKFAREAFPHVQKAVAWLEAARKRDLMHVLPAGAPRDDEFRGRSQKARITGDNFYGLDGLYHAILLARVLGHTATAAAWQKEYNNYYHTVFSRLHQIGKTDGDYMPPGLDIKGGIDWGNLLALYPHELLSPNDPLVTNTLQHTMAEYGEGLLKYLWGVHDYLGMNNTESFIIRGQQRSALRDLYAELVHTSATQAGWECGAAPWTTRDFYHDLAPHGWFAADYIAMVRNMLVRGQGHTLQIFSVLSPKWTQPGDIISLHRAPTRFGTVSLWAIFTSHGMVLHIHGHFRHSPKSLRLHIPWYVAATAASADGKPLAISKAGLLLPVNTRVVRILWNRAENLQNWSYRAFVKRFEQAWQARYFDHKVLTFGNGLHVWPK